MRLPADQLTMMRKAFGSDGLALHDFVRLMLKTSSCRTETERELFVADLTELFAHVDVNSDGSMTWEE
ncbi:unnamed protein product, partial [Phaeothamnion confervicola]